MNKVYFENFYFKYVVYWDESIYDEISCVIVVCLYINMIWN